jgi:pSer/pThr/pTyr-binding forkhead associated (FHA) protein
VADGVPFPDPAPAPRRVELRTANAVVGRASGSTVPDVDCVSADTGVSRRHVQLSLGDDGTWTVTDLGSTNGTFVAGERLLPNADTPLPAGSAVKIGAYTAITLEPAGTVDPADPADPAALDPGAPRQPD